MRTNKRRIIDSVKSAPIDTAKFKFLERIFEVLQLIGLNLIF
jgi:hypothetical protein